VTLKVGISLVSVDQARSNLEEEVGSTRDAFETVRVNAEDEWNDQLGRIEVEGGTPEQREKFYTNLYRCYTGRTIWSDVDGHYVDPKERVRRLDESEAVMLGGDAFWNTFWNLNQLWTLANPRIAEQWVQSLLQMYRDTGWLAKGPAGLEYTGIMVASHEIPLMVAAYQKGIRNYDIETAYEAIRHVQTTPALPDRWGGPVGNRQLDVYQELGYVSVEEGPVSNTLEYAFDDWAAGQMAKALGRTEDYRMFVDRAQNYQNVFDPSTGYVRPRHEEGSWDTPFDPFSSDGFVEGNSWQYSWFVPHDLNGLVDLIGQDAFIERLDEGFKRSEKDQFKSREGYVNHGNQPNMQAAYLFNYAGAPWLTQKWARAIMNEYYGSSPTDGWPGDEDQGQMGAWYVMSAMGLFEMRGGASTDPVYDIGSPIFDRVTIHLDGDYYEGETFVVEAQNNSPENVYVQSAELNGEELEGPWVRFAEVSGGGKLVLEMGPEPNREWGTDADAPSGGR
jgi:predicted alpha-1,2-mannosidase